MQLDQSLWDQFAGIRGAIMNFPRQRLAFSVAELVPSLLDGSYNCGNVAVASRPHVAVANPPHKVAGVSAANRCISPGR